MRVAPSNDVRVSQKPRHLRLEPGFSLVVVAAACTSAEYPAAEATSATDGNAVGTEASLQTRQPAPQRLAPQLPAPPVTAGRSCTSSERTPALDEQTTLGASPAEMLEWLAGEHRESVVWQDASGDFVVDPTLSELDIVVEPPRAVRLLVSNTEEPSAGFCEVVVPTYGDVLITVDALHFDVRMRISSADGSLDLAVDTTLTSTAADYAEAWVELPLEALAARLPGDATRALLRVRFTPFGNSGELVVSRDGNALPPDAAPRQPVVLRFPADNYCGDHFTPFGASDQTRGASLPAALQRLNALSPLALEESSATLSWTFSPTGGAGCASLGSPRFAGSASFNLPARASLRSSDGQLDGGFDVRLGFSVLDGVISVPSVRAELLLSDLTDTATAVRDFGIQVPLDFSGFETGLLSFRSEREGNRMVGGLAAIGLNPAQPSCTQVGGAVSCESRGGGRVALYAVGWSHPLP
jgi:hypothetical protein